MDVHRDRRERERSAASPPEGAVTAHRSSPERVVFTEEGNTDGWIATDLTVSPDR